MFKSTLAITAGMLCLSFVARAQEKRDYQLIIQDITNSPISNANIWINNQKQAFSSNTEGRVVLKSLPSKKYAVKVHAMGYKTYSDSLLFSAETPLWITLETDQIRLSEAYVARKTETTKLIESGYAVNAIDTRKYANTSTDIAQVLNRSTGVKVREKGGVGGDFEFSVNGLSGKQIRFFIDGVPLEVMGSSMNFNTIPVNLAERVEVYKGVIPVELGADALGGAVNIVTHRDAGNYLDASVSYGSFNTNKNALIGQWTAPKSGISTRINLTSNYSDNNYTMYDVEGVRADNMQGNYIPDLNGSDFFTLDTKRFHNRYRSLFGKAEVGVSNKKYADDLYAFIAYSNFDQQLQTGAEQNNVYGKASKEGNAKLAGIRYVKSHLFTQGLDLSTYWSYTKDLVVVTDTSKRKYFWNNVYTDRDAPEVGNEFTENHINRPQYIGRTTLSYALAEHQKLRVNHIFSHVQNQSWNALHTDEDDNPGTIKKNIIGLSYQHDLSDNRWSNTLFVKYFGLGLRLNKYSSATSIYENIEVNKDNLGYGLSSRYYLIKNLGIKASAEKAFRLQEVGEIFGDGVNTVANLDLRPEHSYNINIGAFYSKELDQHHFFLEGSGFVRYARDFIYAKFYQSNTPRVIYDNLEKLDIKGAEGEFRYHYDQLIGLTLNASYQQSISYSKANGIGNEDTYKKKLPNQPWLFGNAELSVGKNDLLGHGSRLQLNWGLHYIHWYYKTWEGLGAVIDQIPNQFIQNASLTGSFKNGRYNISLECNNLTNALAYDNFRQQKEGRAVYAKLRYFIHQD